MGLIVENLIVAVKISCNTSIKHHLGRKPPSLSSPNIKCDPNRIKKGKM